MAQQKTTGLFCSDCKSPLLAEGFKIICPRCDQDYKQEVRDLIYSRESKGVPIYEIAEKVEKVVRQAVESENLRKSLS